MFCLYSFYISSNCIKHCDLFVKQVFLVQIMAQYIEYMLYNLIIGSKNAPCCQSISEGEAKFQYAFIFNSIIFISFHQQANAVFIASPTTKPYTILA